MSVSELDTLEMEEKLPGMLLALGIEWMVLMIG